MDNKLVIDLSTDPQPGEEFFGLGTSFVKEVLSDLKAGERRSAISEETLCGNVSGYNHGCEVKGSRMT